MKGFLTLATLAAFSVLPLANTAMAAYGLATPLSGADRHQNSANHGYSIQSIVPQVTRLDSRDGISTLMNPAPLGDDNITVVPFGFSFDFFGTTYTEGTLSSNGWLGFGPGNAINGASDNGGTFAHPEQNEAITHDHYDGAKIDFNWDDLDGGAGGEMRIATRGVAPNREFVIDYEAVAEYGGLHTASLQTILYEGSNSVQMNFIDVNDDLGTRNGVSIGIQGSDTQYLQYGYWGGRSFSELPGEFATLSMTVVQPNPSLVTDLNANGKWDEYFAGVVPSYGAPANGEALLFTVPEPTSIALLTLAGLGAIAVRRRRS